MVTDEQVIKFFRRYYRYRPQDYCRTNLIEVIRKGTFDFIGRDREEMVRLSDEAREEVYPPPRPRFREFL